MRKLEEQDWTGQDSQNKVTNVLYSTFLGRRPNQFAPKFTWVLYY